MPHNRETVTLPIFPMPGVVFPAMRMKLRLSHDHFLQGLADLVETDTTLCATLARYTGGDPGAGDLVEPHLIGTTARILDVIPVTADADDIVLVGISRIHLLSYRHNGRQLVGQARYLPDLPESVPMLLLEEARALASELGSTLALPASSQVETWLSPPKPAETLSYWIAALLPINTDDRQELLELRTSSARLSKQVGHMRTILDALRSEFTREPSS